MMDRMKLAGRLAAKKDVTVYGIEYARNMAHALILDRHVAAGDPYTDGYIAEFNAWSKKDA